MPINIVNLADLDTVIAATIKKVHDGVVLARKETNSNVELPKGGIDFTMVVVVENGWQALDAQTFESGQTLGDGVTKGIEKTTDMGTSTDRQTSKETQGGFTTDKRTGLTSDSSTSNGTVTESGTNNHTEERHSVQKNYES